MPNYTPNINLYSKDPTTDGNDTFNIQTMLNENWDKIDDAVNKKIGKDIATAADQVLVSSGAGTWLVKTLTQFKTWLGLGSAAYQNTSTFATSTQGTMAEETASELNAHKNAVDPHTQYAMDTDVSNLQDEVTAHKADDTKEPSDPTHHVKKDLTLQTGLNAQIVNGVYIRNNNGSVEWSADGNTWNSMGGSNGFEFGLPTF